MWTWIDNNPLPNVIVSGTTITGVGGVVVADLGGSQHAAATLAGPTSRTITISGVSSWVAQPSGSSFYTGTTAGAFAVNTTSGVITYTGPTRPFALTADVTMHKAGPNAEYLEIAVAKNSELVGTTTNVTHSQAATITPNLAQNVCARRFTTLSNGDTIRAVVRNAGTTDSIIFLIFTLSAEALAS